MNEVIKHIQMCINTMLSDISQKEKDKYQIISLKYRES